MAGQIEESGKLTDMKVLRATAAAVRPMSGYIYDELRHGGRAHRREATYQPFTRDAILRRLRKLARGGLLECVGGPDGYYGYTWRITDTGRFVLNSAVSQ